MSDDNPAMAWVNVGKHHSSATLSQPDLENLAELVATRILVHLERCTRTPNEEAQELKDANER